MLSKHLVSPKACRQDMLQNGSILQQISLISRTLPPALPPLAKDMTTSMKQFSREDKVREVELRLKLNPIFWSF